MTPQLCAERCLTNDFKISGVEYGQECWCGNTINFAGNAGATPGRNVTDSECKFLCPGDKKTFCGAGSRMSVYLHKSLSEQ